MLRGSSFEHERLRWRLLRRLRPFSLGRSLSVTVRSRLALGFSGWETWLCVPRGRWCRAAQVPLGQFNLKPTSRDLGRGNLAKKTGSFTKGDIGIVLANFAMHSDGKIPDVQVEKIEKWLRRRSAYDERALRALPRRVVRCSSASRSRDQAARSRSRAFEEESLWESAIRLRSASGD